MGKLQSEFSKSSNSLMDHGESLKMVANQVKSFSIPDDFKGNPTEFQRRSKESLGRLLGDEYMLAIQNETRFDLKGTLAKISKAETPNTLNESAATIENRVITAGETIDPARRLRDATMSTQQAFLEQAAIQLKDESARAGTVSPTGAIEGFAKSSYSKGLTPSDVANYAMLTEGVDIPKDTLTKVVTTPKPKDEPRAETPAAAVKASAPAGP